MVKNPPAMQETWAQFLGWEDPWRRAWQPTPVFLPGGCPWTEEPGGLQSMGSKRAGHDWATKRSTAHDCYTKASHATRNFPEIVTKMKYWLINKWLRKVWILVTLTPFPFHSFWHSCQGSKWYIPNNIPLHLKCGIITIPHLPLLLIKHFWLCNRECYFLLFILTRNQNQWQFQYI